MTRFTSLLAAMTLCLTTAVACSSDDDETVDPDAGVEDVGNDIEEEGDVDEISDVADPDDADGEPDANQHQEDASPDVTPDEGCQIQGDCADDEYCHEQECHEAPECSSVTSWLPCVSAFEDIDDDLARRAHCGGSHCRISCLTDQECADGHVCTDDGKCREFTGDLTGEHPGGDQSAPLQAGFSNVLMHFPIGLSLGGYGSRAAINDGRYVDALAASHGKMHGLHAGGVALDDGQRQLLFLRAPIIFPSMAVHEAVSRNLQQETGHDWRSSLVISGSHTHSGPARFWQLPDPNDILGDGMGLFGIDEYHEESYRWLVESLTEAAMEALDDLAPAKMGWEVVESFDVDDVISSDRRGETPPFDDNRVLLMRIDDPDDNPRGVLVSFGTHGTVHSGSYANNDVMVGIEKQLEYTLGDRYARHVPVYYFNQNGGSMSPRGRSNGHRHTQRFENLGVHLVDRTFDAITSMETTEQWSFSGHTHRFSIVHEHLDYGEREFDDYPFGALMCGSETSEDFADHSDPNDYGCAIGLHHMLAHRPATILAKSQISAFELNDLTLVTMPGELTMPLGWQVQRELRDSFDIDPFNSFTWGYAQDHLLYLLPTNLRGELPPFPGISTPKAPDEYPNYAFSYLQGGYETQMSPWGHNLGDFLVDRAVEAVGLMKGEIDAPAHPAPYPDQFSSRGHEPFAVDATDSAEVGTIVEQPPAVVERRQFVEFAWLGGDPGAEMPQAPRATLQRLEEGEFQTVQLDNYLPYDNREFVMLTRLREGDGDDQYEWVIYWEELVDFPTGSYRFRIDGHHLDADIDERVPYEAVTESFELVPSTELMIGELAVADENTIAFRLDYPAAEELRVEEVSGDRGAVTGSYRMHHRDVATGQPIFVDADQIDSVDVTITDQPPGSQIGVQDFSATTGPENGTPVTRVQIDLNGQLQPGQQLGVEIEAGDTLGNQASTSATLEFHP